MLGSATLTIETSSRVMNPAARTTPSAFQRSGSGAYSSWRGVAGRGKAAEAADRGSSTPGSMGSSSDVWLPNSDDIRRPFADLAIGVIDPVRGADHSVASRQILAGERRRRGHVRQ